MPRVFISYRRDDSTYVPDILNAKLKERFGSDSVFFDIDNIPFGVDFRTHIGNAVGRCDVLLVLIGDDWVDLTNEAGTRRLDEPADFVRIEIEAALARDIPVIPVLVGKADMPQPVKLPESIRDLAYRNAAEIRSGRDFQLDIDRLIRGIDAACSSDPSNAQFAPSSGERILQQGSGQHGKPIVTAEKILQLLNGYTHRCLFVAPQIPQIKLQNAVAHIAPFVRPSDVLLLYDNTVFGSAKNGLVFTAEELHWCGVFEPHGKILYQDVKNVGTHTWFLLTTLVLNGKAIGESTTTKGLYQILANLLYEIAKLCKPAANE